MSVGFLFLDVLGALAGVAFFVAVADLALRTAALPRWSGWLAVIGAVAHLRALLGALSLAGPVHPGEGIIGGISAPLGVFVAWTIGVSAWWLRQARRADR